MTRRSYFFYPAALGLTSAAALVIAAGPSATSATLATLWVAAALAVGSRLYFLGARDVRQAGKAAARQSPERSDNHALRDLCLRAMPVWAKQLETSRREGDEAVVALSQIFGATVGRLSNAVAASRGAVREL